LQASIGAAMRSELSDRIPDLALLDIRGPQLADLQRRSEASSSLGRLDALPHLRTIIRRVNGKPATDALVNARRTWLVEGDVGLSWSAEPVEANLLAGRWWSADYRGPTLISIEEDVADAFGIGPGDTMAFSVMGRDIEGEVANVREEKDRDFRINFLLVTSPEPLRHAPHTWVGTIDGEDQAIASFMRDVGSTAPNITIVDVR
jgi:putative ABC transport system permease protein